MYIDRVIKAGAALLVASFVIWFIFFSPPNDNNDKLNTAVTNATITNQEAINTLLDENQSLKAHVDKLITQMCYVESIATDAWANVNDDKSYAGFSVQGCIDNLRIVNDEQS